MPYIPLMLWIPSTGTVLLVSSATVSSTCFMVSTTLGPTLVLAYDGGTYDAGISATSTSSHVYDRDSYTVLLLVLVHELLVVCTTAGDRHPGH